jgi:hypothetical protein
MSVLSELFDDIAWWVEFMNMFNGTVNILDLKPITCLQTDACLQGGAGYYEGDFFYVNWDIDLPQFKNYYKMNGLLVYHTISITLFLPLMNFALISKL